MHYVQHRVNTLEALGQLPERMGAEIDVRSELSRPGSLHLAHDPWQPGCAFGAWLQLWARRPRGLLVVNTKEDGLEPQILALLAEHAVTDFVFLDTALPTLVRLANAGLGAHLSLRLSAWEPAENLIPWARRPVVGRPRLLWVDCFAHRPLPVAIVQPWAETFATCLVSPELQGAPLAAAIYAFTPLARTCAFLCTKEPAVWLQQLQKE